MGGGTLFLDGKSYPFKIAGLGVGEDQAAYNAKQEEGVPGRDGGLG